MTKRVWTTDEIITKAILDTVLVTDANGESADDLTKLAVKDQSGAGSFALELLSSETLTADRILTLTVNNAARTINLSGNLVLAGTLTTTGAITFAGAFTLGVTLTANTTLTLPTSGPLTTLLGTETLASKTLTAPDINGGTADSFTSLSIRSTGAAYDLLFATAVVFTANRTLTITIPDAPTALTLTGDLIRSGAHSLTLTTTATTVVTFPASGTVSTLAGTETLTNKTLTAPSITNATLTGTLALPDGTVTEADLVVPSADGLHARRIARATYDFAVDGGAISTIGLGVTIPDNAIVVRAWYEVLTTLTSATDAATVALTIPTDDVGGIVAAIAISDASNPWDAGNHEAIQTGTVANFANKCTAARGLSMTIATEALTAGKFILYAEYIASD